MLIRPALATVLTCIATLTAAQASSPKLKGKAVKHTAASPRQKAGDKSAASIPLSTTEITVSPIKVNDNAVHFHVPDISRDLDVTISNLQGRPFVHHRYEAGTYRNDLVLPAPYLNPGLYIVTFERPGYKMVKQVEFE